MKKPKKITAAQLRALKADLEERKRQLLRDGTAEGLRVREGGDEADQANAAYENEMAALTAARGSEELGQVLDALERIEAGHYGTCEACKGVIGAARLQALPFADLCIDCQEKKEAGVLDSLSDRVN